MATGMTCPDPYDIRWSLILMGVLVGLAAGKLLSDWGQGKGS